MKRSKSCREKGHHKIETAKEMVTLRGTLKRNEYTDDKTKNNSRGFIIYKHIIKEICNGRRT